MATHTRFKGFADVSSALLNDQLESNIVSYLNFATLNAGGFANVTIPSSGAYGDDYSRLSPLNDVRYTNGQIWQAARQNWVYESGVEYSTQPIQISGISVNNTFLPISTTTGASGYYINYPLGQVVFNNAINPSGTVKVEYSYKYINYVTSAAPQFKEIQTGSLRVDDSHFRQSGSGDWSLPGENRLQLPAVCVEAGPNRFMAGRQLGGGQVVKQELLLHIITETPYDKNQLIDILSYQNDKTIYLYDKNLLESGNKFPLDYRGALQSGAWTYPDLVSSSTYYWRKCTFGNTSVQPKRVAVPLYGAIVRTLAEVIISEI